MATDEGTTAARPRRSECVGEETVAAYVTRDLDAHESAGVDSHLAECTECRRRVSALAKVMATDGGLSLGSDGGSPPKGVLDEPSVIATVDRIGLHVFEEPDSTDSPSEA